MPSKHVTNNFLQSTMSIILSTQIFFFTIQSCGTEVGNGKTGNKPTDEDHDPLKETTSKDTNTSEHNNNKPNSTTSDFGIGSESTIIDVLTTECISPFAESLPNSFQLKSTNFNLTSTLSEQIRTVKLGEHQTFKLKKSTTQNSLSIDVIELNSSKNFISTITCGETTITKDLVLDNSDKLMTQKTVTLTKITSSQVYEYKLQWSLTQETDANPSRLIEIKLSDSKNTVLFK